MLTPDVLIVCVAALTALAYLWRWNEKAERWERQAKREAQYASWLQARYPAIMTPQECDDLNAQNWP